MGRSSNIKFRLLGLVLIFYSLAPAVAQGTKVQASVDKSPLGTSSFLGIELDKPFPGEMQECPRMHGLNLADRIAAGHLGNACFFQKSGDVFEVLNGPDLGLSHTLEIRIFQGMPISFRMKIGKSKFSQLEEIFTQKYGPAHRGFSESLQTGEGQRFSSRVREWEGSRLRIRLDEFGEDVYWGSATIENVDLRNVFEAQKKAAARKAASKL